MSEAGQSWRRAFAPVPASAPLLRRWARGYVTHPDAPLVADELFVGVLAANPVVVEVTLSTADVRVRITARGAARPLQRHADDTSRRIVAALSIRTGMTPDTCGLWAELSRETL